MTQENVNQKCMNIITPQEILVIFQRCPLLGTLMTLSIPFLLNKVSEG